jgi:hypothetical protein
MTGSERKHALKMAAQRGDHDANKHKAEQRADMKAVEQPEDNASSGEDNKPS